MTSPLVLSRPLSASTPFRRGLRPGAKPTHEGTREKSRTADTAGARTEGGDSAEAWDRDNDRIAATATSMAVACLEIFAGIRRSDSISRWVDRTLLAKIDQRAQLRAEVAPPKPVGEFGSARTLQAGSARVCRVNEVVAEVTVIVRTHSRFRAVAIRLELITTRWTMTALQTM